MSIFRSEDMYLYKLVMSKDNEKAIINILGQRDMAHFVDMNRDEQVFNLPYIELIKRCDETDKKLSFLIDKCQQYEIELAYADSVEELDQLTHDIAIYKKKVRFKHLPFRVWPTLTRGLCRAKICFSTSLKKMSPRQKNS
jgi:hypothetical protein